MHDALTDPEGKKKQLLSQVLGSSGGGAEHVLDQTEPDSQLVTRLGNEVVAAAREALASEIEESVERDPAVTVDRVQSSTLFDCWLNTCPTQGSRTIRSEEALLVSLAAFRSHVVHNKAPLQAPQQPPSAPADGL